MRKPSGLQAAPVRRLPLARERGSARRPHGALFKPSARRAFAFSKASATASETVAETSTRPTATRPPENG